MGERINPILDKEEYHDGVDIACEKGTPAIAVQSGIVTETGVSTTYGNFLKYKTNQDYEVMYAHLDKALVEKGDEIEQNQSIALTGNSGMVTGPHLHYSIWKDEALVDPMKYLTLPYTEDVSLEYAQRGETFIEGR